MIVNCILAVLVPGWTINAAVCQVNRSRFGSIANAVAAAVTMVALVVRLS